MQSNPQPSAEVGTSLAQAWSTVDAMLDGFVSSLPQIGIAIVVFALFWLAAVIARKAIRRATSHREATLGKAMGRLAQVVILIGGLLVAVAIIAPSVTPAKLLSALGVGGVAIGFAFKDILQNFLAGILILVRKPFEVGDQIRHGDFEGTVVEIDTRATVIKTYDGRHVLIPNGEVYTNPVVVNTAEPHRRSEYDVGIGYADDIDEATQQMLEAMQTADGVLDDPAPEVIALELAGSSVNLRARWWTEPQQAEVMRVRHAVIREIKRRLDDAAIDMPYPTNVVLFHDQTEATDGDRTAQREGWPAGDDPPKPRGRRRPGGGSAERSLHARQD